MRIWRLGVKSPLSLAIRHTAAVRFPPALSPTIVIFSGSVFKISHSSRELLLPHSSPPGEPGICVPEQACILRKLQYVLLPVPFWSRHGHNFPRFPLPSHRHEKTAGLEIYCPLQIPACIASSVGKYSGSARMISVITSHPAFLQKSA